MKESLDLASFNSAAADHELVQVSESSAWCIACGLCAACSGTIATFAAVASFASL